MNKIQIGFFCSKYKHDVASLHRGPARHYSRHTFVYKQQYSDFSASTVPYYNAARCHPQKLGILNDSTKWPGEVAISIPPESGRNEREEERHMWRKGKADDRQMSGRSSTVYHDREWLHSSIVGAVGILGPLSSFFRFLLWSFKSFLKDATVSRVLGLTRMIGMYLVELKNNFQIVKYDCIIQ